MPETYGIPEPEQSVEDIVRENAVPVAREVISGHREGAVRRILLYVLVFALVVSPWPVAAVVPLTLLALTDQLA